MPDDVSDRDRDDALARFHPRVASWFRRDVGEPTDVQARAWPLIARGDHLLVSAPTGTGKTLAAFLWGLDRLATGAWAAGAVRILYVSPLKALNNDVQKNLLAPLAALREEFRRSGEGFPDLRVLTRSGDTPQSERRRMVRTPPEILITTPESLNLLLSSPSGRGMLRGLAAVILDEIHAVAGTKRGTHLMTAVERLALLGGEFQRIALSATVRPLAGVADLVAGFELLRIGGEASYRRRRIEVVSSPAAKRYEIEVRGLAPGASGEPVGGRGPAGEPDSLWRSLAEQCRAIIRRNRSTLVFANSRRHAEKVARFINEAEGAIVAYAHHGSLSRELRLVVEQRLKHGELSAIVATSSLELGIDVGTLDEVVIVGTPFTVASAVQRLGRAGHQVSAASRGTVFPLHGRDLVDAAVVARAVREADIEETAPVAGPLDVLAQVIVSMTAVETWSVDGLYDAVRTSLPYHELPRRQFDLVVAMLAGRYADARMRELEPLVSVDGVDGTVRARAGALQRLYASGGTIPDRGQFDLRAMDGARIGELDEEFVWERTVGDSFLFGTQAWQIRGIDHQAVTVAPVEARAGMAPFWRAEERNRDLHLAELIARTLEEWNPRLDDPDLRRELAASCGLSASAAEDLVAFLVRQRAATGADLPHRHHLLVEHLLDPLGGRGVQVVLHTLWGGRVNRPFAIALRAAWQQRMGWTPEIHQDDDAIMVFVPDDVAARDILGLVDAASIERLLCSGLEASGYFGARFRESAGRALLLPKAAVGRRMPLWLTRLRAKNLLEAVRRYEDFPMILETWRCCLRDEFDLPGLARLLDELSRGEIRVTECSPGSPSPFAAGVLWKQTNALMYADDAPRTAAGSGVRLDLVREVALAAELRPRIPVALAEELEGKLDRTASGWTPRDPVELLDLLKERVALPREAWERLLAACERDLGTSRAELLAPLGAKVAEIVLDGAAGPVVAAAEVVPRIRRALAGEQLAAVVAEWLQTRGPVAPRRIADTFGLDDERLEALLRDLVEGELVVVDRLLEGTDDLLACDRENLERLLCARRTRARPTLVARPICELSRLLARRHGLLERASGREGVDRVLEMLAGFGLPARLWEEEVLPARVQGYREAWLDALVAEREWAWFGCGKERVGFARPEDLELFLEREPGGASGRTGPSGSAAIVPPRGRFAFWDLVADTGLSSAELSDRLWEHAWAGAVSCDSFGVVRRGIASRFRAVEVAEQGRAGRRSGFTRWQSSRPAAGLWYRLQTGDGGERDALDEEEIDRDRVRILARRHGVLFRELLENELPLLRWSRLFRSLRSLELSGELVSARYFEGVPGVQFGLPGIEEELAAQEPGGEETAWGLNACDPASLCGIGLESLKGLLPPRLPTTHVVFLGSQLAIVSRRLGRALEIRLAADDRRLSACLAVVKDLASRRSSVHVESINGEPAPRSPWARALLDAGFVEDFRRLSWRAGP